MSDFRQAIERTYTRRRLLQVGFGALGALVLGGTMIELVTNDREAPTTERSRDVSRVSEILSVNAEKAREYIQQEATIPDDKVLVLGGDWCGACNNVVTALHKIDVPTTYLKLNPDDFRAAFEEAREVTMTLPERVVAPVLLYGTRQGVIGTTGIDVDQEMTRIKGGMLSLYVFRTGGGHS